MTDVWTHGRWIVRPGQEDELVRALTELSRAAQRELDAPLPTLLRDREQPNVFLTFACWASDDDIERFRAFLFPRLGPLRKLLEGFEPHTLDRITFDE